MPQARLEWRDPRKERRWRNLLDQWRRSGLTGRDFCAQHHLSEPSFYAWKREIARRDQERQGTRPTTPPKPRPDPARAASSVPPVFMQVWGPSPAPTSSAVEVILTNGRVLRLMPGFDTEVLRQALAVLEASAC